MDQEKDFMTPVIEASKEAAWAGQTVEGHQDRKYVMVPQGMHLEELQDNEIVLPEHIEETETLLDMASFIGYINRFKSNETVIFADHGEAAMQAEINYHEASNEVKDAEPGKCTHSARFQCGFDPDWKKWREISGRYLSQIDFAYFVEDMLHTIASPDGADLLEMAQDLKVHRNVAFKQNVRMTNNTVDLQYEETDETTTSKGKFNVPETLMIVVPVYMNREAIQIEVKLRYRADKGEPLKFALVIVGIERIELAEFQKMTGEIAEATDCPLYLGKLDRSLPF
jgi:uncharacterized protein YfdQ (DUF2303 family)